MKIEYLDLTKKTTDIEVTEDTKYMFLHNSKEKITIDNAFSINHKKEGIKSRVIIKIILKEKDSLNLIPKIKIDKKAKKTNCKLNISILLLSSKINCVVTPALEILNNDIRASHSLTISTLDKNQLLYLQSRGLSLKQAKQLLINSFINL